MSKEMDLQFKELLGEEHSPSHVVKQDLDGNTIAVFCCEETAEDVGTQLYPDYKAFCCYNGYMNALVLEWAPKNTLH